MTFTLTDYTHALQYARNPMQNFVSNMMNSYQQGVKARYAPQTAQAEIFNKEFAPLSQIAGNPALFNMFSPEQRTQIANVIGNLLKNSNFGGQSGQGGQNNGSTFGGLFGGGGGGNNSSPAPNQGGGNLGGGAPQNSGGGGGMPAGGLGAIPPAGGNGGMSGSPQTSPDASGAPSNQSTSNFSSAPNDLSTSVQQHAGSEYKTQLYPAGTGYVDQNGKYKITSTPGMLNDDQVAMGAIQSGIPLLQRLQEEGDDLLKNGKAFKLLGGMSGAALRNLSIDTSQLKKLGIDPSYYDRYIQFQTDQNDAATRLESAYKYGHNVPGENRALSQVQPGALENGVAYRKRMENEINKLKMQNDIYKGHTTSGFNVSPGAAPETPNSRISNKSGNDKTYSSSKHPTLSKVSQDKINHTAQKYNKTPQQVMSDLGLTNEQ